MTLVRVARSDDLPAASAVCLAAFHDRVAPTLGAEGVATFEALAQPEAFAARQAGGNRLWVAEHAGRVVGVVELRELRHLSMLFVDPGCQGQGIGWALVQAVVPAVLAEGLTVNASLTSVEAYLRFGFTCTGEVFEQRGLVCQPMVLALEDRAP